jgi:hypothetical protein
VQVASLPTKLAISVQKGNPLTPRIIKRKIPRRAHASVRLRKDSYPGIFFGIIFKYSQTAVRRAVINKKSFKVSKGLRQ